MKSDYISSDKIVTKHVLKHGIFTEKPTEGSTCHLTIENIETVPSNLDLSPLNSDILLASSSKVVVKVDETNSEVDRYIEKAIKWMGCKERALITLNMPVMNSKNNIEKIKFITTLTEIEKMKPIWNWTPVEKYSTALSYKKMAVELVKAERFKDAFWRFSKAVKLIITLEPIDDLELDEALYTNIDNLRTNLYNNMAMCQLKYNNYDHVIELCSKVLKRDGNNVKAMYRRGCAYGAVKNIEKALADFQKAVHVEPNNTAALEKMKHYNELWDTAIKRSDELYKKMLKL